MLASDVKWGSYKEYEGPYSYGLGKLDLQTFPTRGHVLLDVVTQTEGGSPSAVNAYDRCIVSLGLLQWCEAKYFLSSKMLGAIASKDPALLDPLRESLTLSGAEFKQKALGKWRFFYNDGEEVDTAEEQHRLFFNGSNGYRGQWEEADKVHAKEWVAAFVNTLHQPEAIDVQVSFTADRMYNFATRSAKGILFEDGKTLEGWPGAVQAGFLSFAANLPAVASKHLGIAVASTTAPKWSQDWCIHILKQLTFGPGISIYPHRYDKIRPRIEHHFGIDLPDFSAELKQWEADQDAGHDAPLSREPSFRTTEEIQQFLVDQGYDLGSSGPQDNGVDGREGPKTRDAIRTFQRLHHLEDDGLVGKRTRAKMLEVTRTKMCI